MNNQRDNKNYAVYINTIFNECFSLFPSTYAIIKKTEELNQIKHSWWQALEEAELIKSEFDFVDKQKIWRGLSRMRLLNQPFMPSCGQFIALCLED